MEPKYSLKWDVKNFFDDRDLSYKIELDNDDINVEFPHDSVDVSQLAKELSTQDFVEKSWYRVVSKDEIESHQRRKIILTSSTERPQE